MMESNSWFKVEQLRPKLWRIDDNGQDTIYLVEGSKRALLIDTGWGIGDLKALVTSLTPLPILVVNTHGHPDHVCGNGQFETIHIHPHDIPLLEGNFTQEGRVWMKDNFLSSQLSAFSEWDSWIQQSMPNVIPISQGFRFELGGRTLEVIELSGHTPGCICLLDHNEQLLFSGDSILEGQVWLHLDHSLPLADYLQSLQSLDTYRDQFAHILPGHNSSMLKPNILTEIEQGVSKILQGNSQGKSCLTHVGEGVSYKFGSTGIVCKSDTW